MFLRRFITNRWFLTSLRLFYLTDRCMCWACLNSTAQRQRLEPSLILVAVLEWLLRSAVVSAAVVLTRNIAALIATGPGERSTAICYGKLVIAQSIILSTA